MRLFQTVLPVLVVAGFMIIVSACSQMKSVSGLPVSHPEPIEIGQQVSCAECHEDNQKGTLKAYDAFSHTPAFVKNHRFYASTDERLCSTCHKVSFCTDCHTNQTEIKPSMMLGNRPDRDAPHRGNFMTLHKIEGKLDPASCNRCHGRANNERCIICHR